MAVFLCVPREDVNEAGLRPRRRDPENNIPVPVVGGLLFAAFTAVLYGTLDIRPGFDMALKEPMMLVFFATFGLGADLKLLKQGGPRLLLFAGADSGACQAAPPGDGDASSAFERRISSGREVSICRSRCGKAMAMPASFSFSLIRWCRSLMVDRRESSESR